MSGISFFLDKTEQIFCSLISLLRGWGVSESVTVMMVILVMCAIDESVDSETTTAHLVLHTIKQEPMSIIRVQQKLCSSCWNMAQMQQEKQCIQLLNIPMEQQLCC